MNIEMKFCLNDLETFPNCFLAAFKIFRNPKIHQFEISDRKNQIAELLQFLSWLQNSGYYLVGYNNLNFDYPITHELLNNQWTFNAAKASQLATQIIQTQKQGFSSIPLKERHIPQIDLFKINHFDNAAKSTSLKALQFAMRSESVEDLPFEVRRLLFEEMDVLINYNGHDLTETERFLEKNLHLIKMRQELIESGTLSGDVLNYSDVKIGTEYLIRKIGRAKCFVQGSTPRQTFRESISFKDIILPKIYFRTEEFDAVRKWFGSQTLWIKSEDERPHLETILARLPFHFGIGGVHASVSDRVFESNEQYVIKDVDVSGMYVAVAIANGFFPEHLGQDFVVAYKQLQSDRKQYAKGTTMNKVLKLAGNGVYGNSNNPWSCFYDPKYTFTVTVNGQLQLIQLVELFTLIPELQVIQANTDGVTVYMPRKYQYLFDLWCREWESMTGLKLEHVEYKKMWIRDVNNYLAVGVDGKVKRKGAYWFPESDEDYEGNWNKDFSSIVVQKGIEQVLVNGWNPDAVVRCVTDPFDFMLRYKTTHGATVYIGDQAQPKTVRYYVSRSGQPMKKISKPKGEIGTWKRKNGITDSEFNRVFATLPLGAWDERIHTKNKSKYEAVETSIESGFLVKNCNRASDFNWSDVDFDYYAEKIRKLIVGAK